MLLQIMEEGHLTDSFGRKVDFKNTVLIMTTNVGARSISSPDFGFVGNADEDASYESMKKNVMSEIQREFKPEFIGRLDEVIVFHKLTEENLKAIVDIELTKVRQRLKERGLALELSEEAKALIIGKGKGDEQDSGLDYGARPLRRAVEMYVEDPLSEELLRGAFEGKNTIRVEVKEVGDEKSLDFVADYVVEPDESLTLEAVGAGAGVDDSGSGDSTSEG
ncbi:MAG: AAA family ATPase [Planctomycetaceae bacterium]